MKSRVKWFKCDDCKRKVRRIKAIKNGKPTRDFDKADKQICGFCYRNMFPQTKGTSFSLEKALAKTYEVKGFVRKDGSICAILSFPSILTGHKFKIQLVD